MTLRLQDPDLPPGAIVETFGDGGALRNDGTRLNPAAQNPWYVLATVAGEQGGDWFSSTDDDLHVRNRRLWNGWMCREMEEAERAAIAERLRLSTAELQPLNKEEMQKIIQRFEQVFPESAHKYIIPKLDKKMILSYVYFSKITSFKGFYFSVYTNFEESHFDLEAKFNCSYFKESVYFKKSNFRSNIDFERACFTEPAIFAGAYFGGYVEFGDAKFDKTASFICSHFDGFAGFTNSRFTALAAFANTRFRGKAVFTGAHFVKRADFRSACFDGEVNFENSQFVGTANFSDGAFKAATKFREAHFKSRVSEFYQRTMHQNTTFSDDRRFWPVVTDKNADDDKQAYTRLRQIAAANHNPDLEHFFLRQEMRCKQHLANGFDKCFFWGYNLFSDYGISVARPVAWLVLVFVIGWAAIGWNLWVPEQEGSRIAALRQGAGISIGNMLPFLGIVPSIFPGFHAAAPWWLNTMAVLQSFAGIVLLFFLGLGLRNRFRLR